MIGIVGPRAGFRVVLHPEHRLIAHGQGSHSAVIEVQMGDLHPLGGQRISPDGKAMVLTGDLHRTGTAAGMI